MFRTPRTCVAVGVLVAVVAVAAGAYAQSNPYRTLENFFKMPDGRKVGSTAGITLDRDGSHVWISAPSRTWRLSSGSTRLASPTGASELGCSSGRTGSTSTARGTCG
jgi:hypothetical protein